MPAEDGMDILGIETPVELEDFIARWIAGENERLAKPGHTMMSGPGGNGIMTESRERWTMDEDSSS